MTDKDQIAFLKGAVECFFKECIELDENGTIYLDELCNAFDDWKDERIENIPTATTTALGKQVRSFGGVRFREYERVSGKRISKTFYKGISFKAVPLKGLEIIIPNRNRNMPEGKYWKSESFRKSSREYAKRRYHSDPLYRLKLGTRRTANNIMRKKGFTKTKRSREYLGCTDMDFYNRISKNGTIPFEGHHVDHIVPLCLIETLEDAYALFHYTNQRLITGEENMRKGHMILPMDQLPNDLHPRAFEIWQKAYDNGHEVFTGDNESKPLNRKSLPRIKWDNADGVFNNVPVAKGSQVSSAILDESEAITIKILLRNGMGKTEISRGMSDATGKRVSVGMVRDIKRNNTWKHVSIPDGM